MSWLDYLTIGGTIVTVYGTFLALRSEKRAKNSAQIAEDAKKEIIKHKSTTTFSEILYKTKRVQQTFGKYTISNTNSLVGFDIKEDVEILQSYIFDFNENRYLINEKTEIDGKRIYTDLNKLQESFINCLDTDRKKYAKQIRIILDDIVMTIKNTIDKRIEE